MRVARIILLIALAGIATAQAPDSLARWRKAQQYASEGFTPVDNFAGQVRVGSKRLSRQPFSVFAANGEMKCCGKLVASGQTDAHGHFFVEPLAEGRYFAKFEANDGEHLASVAVMQSYDRCSGATHVEIDFLNPKKPTIQTFVDIIDSGEPCKEGEPQCFRK